MGQVALGFRSLLIKLGVFFLLAMMLAWSLGGTLWPRAEIVDIDGVMFDGQQWNWRLSVGGRKPESDRPNWGWILMCASEGSERRIPFDDRIFAEVAGPVCRVRRPLHCGASPRRSGVGHPVDPVWHGGHLGDCARPSGGVAPG